MRPHFLLASLLFCAAAHAQEIETQNPQAAAQEGILSIELKSQGRFQEALSHAENGLRLLGAEASSMGPKGYRTAVSDPIAPDVYECDRADFEIAAGNELESCLSINAAGLYVRQLQLDSARPYYEKALERTTLRKTEVRANLAWIEVLRSDPDAALGFLEPVSDTASPRVYLVTGVVFRETGRLAEAREALEKAAVLYEEAGDIRGQARALAHLGTLHLGEARVEEAQICYERALELAEKSNDVEARWHALGGLAKTLGSVSYYEQYLDLVSELGESFATDQGKVSVLSNHDGILEEYVRLVVLDASARGRFDEARAKVERIRARSLGALLSARQDAAEPGVLDLERFEMSRMEQMSPGVRTHLRAPDSPTPDVAPPPMAFLEYFTLGDVTAIFTKSRTGEVAGATVPLGAEALRSRIEAFRAALGVPTPRGVVSADRPAEPVEDLQKELYRLLVAPVADALPANPDDVVTIVPHGPLWFLPFAALRKDDGTFLVDEHLLAVAASEESWAVSARRVRPEAALAWVAGNPRMPETVTICGEDASFGPLPGAEQEAERVAEILGTEDLYLGKSADRLRFEAWHGAFSIIHLATHGVVCDDPLSSYLVLSDVAPDELSFDEGTSRLTLRSDTRRPIEVRGRFDANLLELSGILPAGRVINGFRLNADLVTLSACQTGLGLLSSEGIIGFSRAFLAAGARSLLMSLWRVDDAATRDWMISFYEAYASHRNKAKAYRYAADRARERRPEPRFWAGFSLLGLAD